MIKLRGHHLICLHFFQGEGYDAAFRENLSRILKRVQAGEEIALCSGADYVCKVCPYLKGGKCSYDKNAEIEIRKMDSYAVKLLGFNTKDALTWVDIKNRFPKIFIRWSEKYCTHCDWRWACERQNNFKILINERAENKF